MKRLIIIVLLAFSCLYFSQPANAARHAAAVAGRHIHHKPHRHHHHRRHRRHHPHRHRHHRHIVLIR